MSFYRVSSWIPVAVIWDYLEWNQTVVLYCNIYKRIVLNRQQNAEHNWNQTCELMMISIRGIWKRMLDKRKVVCHLLTTYQPTLVEIPIYLRQNLHYFFVQEDAVYVKFIYCLYYLGSIFLLYVADIKENIMDKVMCKTAIKLWSYLVSLADR